MRHSSVQYGGKLLSFKYASNEAISLHQILSDLNITQYSHEPFTINCDNQGVQLLAKYPVNHKRSKHVETFHFIRKLVEGIL